MIRISIVSLISLLLCSSLIAQVNVEFEKENFSKEQQKEMKEMRKVINEGDDLLEKSPPRYTEAIEYYLQANNFNPNNALLNYKIGLCYLHTMVKSRAISYLELANKLDPNATPDLKFQLAKAYHLNYEFDKAIEMYTLYRHSLTPYDLTQYGDKIGRHIEECENGKDLMRQPIRVFIDNLGGLVNSEFPEYSPIVNADETILMFTSCRDVTTGGKMDPAYNEYYEDIYISKKDGDVWTRPINPGKPFNDDSHDAIVGLSTDANNVLIYKGDEGMGDIYICRIEEGAWQHPKSLPKEVNTKYHESAAAFSPDMQTLYFVSDREGGYGGSDIYYCKVSPKSKEGKFSFEDPVNMGSAINTPYDEEGVFMQADGKVLYFSSKGHKSMGGYDIFKSVYADDKWSEPVNIGYPVNTPDDDIFFSANITGKHGYYSSFEQNGYGKRDLYMITFLGPEKPAAHKSDYDLLAFEQKPTLETVLERAVKVKDFALVMVKGKILDQLSQGPLGVLIEVINNETREIIANFESNERTGDFMVSLPSGKSYGIAVKAKEYLFHSENFTLPPTTVFQEFTKDIYLKKVEIGSKIILKNIFFEFNEARLKKESIPELERLIKMLNEVPSLKIEISGHTDDVGSELYNQELSEKRAKAVVDYLTAKGIDAGRLSYKGYGLTQPIAANDSEEGRSINRRTEFKVVSR